MSEGVAPQTRGAIEYLHRQGGKRMRPLVVLASTRACGGDPGGRCTTRRSSSGCTRPRW